MADAHPVPEHGHWSPLDLSRIMPPSLKRAATMGRSSVHAWTRQQDASIKAAITVQAAFRGWLVRHPGGLIKPEDMLLVVSRLHREQTGFRNLAQQLLILSSFAVVVLLQRNVGGASQIESSLRKSVENIDNNHEHEEVVSIEDAYSWTRSAYESWYNHDDGLNPDDFTEMQWDMYGMSPGYEAAAEDVPPLQDDAACEAGSGAERGSGERESSRA